MKKYTVRTKLKLKSETLWHWRARKELTQKEAADLAGVSLPTYRNAEYGQLVQLVKASKIAKACHVPLDELKEDCA